MNKREFLIASGAFAGAGVFSRLGCGAQGGEARLNWAGNYKYGASRLHVPKTVDEARAIVKRSRRIKALGTRHSFNSIADSPGDQISLQEFREMELHPESLSVTVGAGVPYGRLAPYLHQRGYALHNLASLPHISVAGACSTATHGSGSKNGNLATAVSEIEIIRADGEVVKLSRKRDGERFAGAVVGLGRLGVVTRLTLQVEPAFDVRQVVYENLPLPILEGRLEEIFASAWSVSLFTGWQKNQATQVWIKRRVEGEDSSRFAPEFFGAKLAAQKLHPLAGHSAENCTEQLGVAGPWYERLPHFRMDFTPSSGSELQSEFFVSRDQAYQAILAVERLRDRIGPHLMISELRTIAADELWMSPCYGRPSMAIHFTWRQDWEAVRSLLPILEEQLAPFDARPHWGKLFAMRGSRLSSLYKQAPEFVKLANEFDPGGKFRNSFLDEAGFGA